MTSKHQITRVRVAGILIREKKILLIAHKKDGQVYWLLPGGGVDYGESLEEALVREFEEELSIAISVDRIALVSDSIDPEGTRHIINICFFCSSDTESLSLGVDERLYDFSYFAINELETLEMFPPINNHLISLMNNEPGAIYKGKIWQNK